MAERGRPRQFDRPEALRLAMYLFWQRGYANTSINDLTAAMGINAPSLYAAFGSKKELFKEAVSLYLALEGGPGRDPLEDHALTTAAALAEMLRGNVCSYVDPDKPSGCMVVLAAMTAAPENDEVRSFLAEVRRGGVEQIRKRLDRGVRDGDLPPETDTRALAEFFGTVLNGLSVQARDGVSRNVLLQVADLAVTTAMSRAVEH